MRRFWLTFLCSGMALAADPMPVYRCTSQGAVSYSDRPCAEQGRRLPDYRPHSTLQTPPKEIEAPPVATAPVAPADEGPEPIPCGRFLLKRFRVLQQLVIQDDEDDPIRCAQLLFQVRGATSRINDNDLAEKLYRAFGVVFEDGLSGPQVAPNRHLFQRRRARYCRIQSGADRLKAGREYSARCCYGRWPAEIKEVVCL